MYYLLWFLLRYILVSDRMTAIFSSLVSSSGKYSLMKGLKR